VAKKLAASASIDSSAVVAPRLLNIKQAAAYLAATVWFLRELVWSRRIPFAKFGNKYVFDIRDLDAFVDAQKTQARS
jgi:excisionase family DNA binding protein